MSPQLSGIYDSAWVQPVAKIQENLAIWTMGAWQYYTIVYQEPIPPGPASTVEMVVASGATTLLANATISKQIVTILQLADGELLQVRFRPLDNVEAVIWEQAGQQKFSSRNIHARVDRTTEEYDPHYSTTTFFILGINRDMALEVRNPMGYATAVARVMFWGIRNIIRPFNFNLAGKHPTPQDLENLRMGNVVSVRNLVGPVTWLPAEGRQG